MENPYREKYIIKEDKIVKKKFLKIRNFIDTIDVCAMLPCITIILIVAIFYVGIAIYYEVYLMY